MLLERQVVGLFLAVECVVHGPLESLAVVGCQNRSVGAVQRLTRVEIVDKIGQLLVTVFAGGVNLRL